MLCLIVFGCHYQCNQLPGKTRLRNDLLCVEWDVKPYTLTHSLQLAPLWKSQIAHSDVHSFISKTPESTCTSQSLRFRAISFILVHLHYHHQSSFTLPLQAFPPQTTYPISWTDLADPVTVFRFFSTCLICVGTRRLGTKGSIWQCIMFVSWGPKRKQIVFVLPNNQSSQIKHWALGLQKNLYFDFLTLKFGIYSGYKINVNRNKFQKTNQNAAIGTSLLTLSAVQKLTKHLTRAAVLYCSFFKNKLCSTYLSIDDDGE